MSDITTLQMSQEDYEKAQKQVRAAMVTEFKNAIRGMIATSESAYQGDRASSFSKRIHRDFSAEDIHRIVTSGSSIEQANLSEYFFATNGLYKRIIIHYATFLTYSWILVPYVLGYGKNKISDSKISRKYFDAADFCTTFQIERKCALFARDIFVRGAYYGLVIEDGENVVILDLPFEYFLIRSFFL